MAATPKKEVINILPVQQELVTVRLVGDSGLIVHAWSEKAKRLMLEKQMRSAKKGAHDAKNPVQDFIDSAYWLTEKPNGGTPEESEQAFNDAIKAGARFGFPITAVKQAAISAAYRSGMSKDKASLRSAFFLDGVGTGNPQMMEIVVPGVPEMREDCVRIGMGTADLRYRMQFNQWSAMVQIRYNKNGQYSLEQIVNMLNLGGFAVGIGEWAARARRAVWNVPCRITDATRQAGQGVAGSGGARYGWRGPACQVVVWHGGAWYGWRGVAWSGGARHGRVRQGLAGKARRG